MKQRNKPLVFAGFLILAILGLGVLPQSVHAASFWDSFVPKIITGAMDIYNIPFAIILMILQAVTGILPVVAGVLLQTIVAISGSVPLTPMSAGAEGTVVTVGWQFTRDLANMFFVLILAWVGFATILRIKDYEIKTILPKLILIALLVNFIPVICGVIIDVADIVTWYFSQKSLNIGALLVDKLPGVEIVRGGTGHLLETLTQLAPGTGGISGIATKSLMGIVFNLVAAFMLILYAVLFVLRVVAIWVLIILAPLAWLGYIVPQGKKMWDMWWKNFIQWTIISVPLMFFLYLSGFVFGGTSFSQCSVNLDQVANQYGVAQAILASIFSQTLFCSILPFTAGILILLIGFILSITFAPSGADKIIQGAKKGGMAAAKVGGTAFMKGPLKGYAKGFGKGFIDTATLRPFREGVKAGGGWKTRGGWAAGLGRTVKTITPPPPKAWVPLAKGYTKAAASGTLKAVKDSTTAGLVAGGLKKKKPKASKQCIGGPPGGPPVGTMAPHFIDDGENPCHICGHIFS